MSDLGLYYYISPLEAFRFYNVSCPATIQSIFSGFIHKTEHNMYYRTRLPEVMYVCESVIFMYMSVCAFMLVSLCDI